MTGKVFDENTIIACCITARWCVCVHSELGNHNEMGCGQWKPHNFKNKVVDEAFINWTGLMALACGSTLAARFFIIVAQNKSPYMALFVFPSSLSLLPKLPQGYEIKYLLPIRLAKCFHGWLRGTSWCSCLVVIFGQCHLCIVEDQGRCLLAPAKYIRRISVKGLSGMWVNITRQLQQQ